MRKTFISFILFAVAFFAGCERYDHLIQDLSDRIEVFEGSSIAPIEEQIRNIKASLADLQDVDKSLSGLIESLNEAASALQTNIDNNAAADAAAKKALEDELASVKELITALQKEDKSLDTKIADLKTYVDQIKASVDNDVADAKTWVSTTFATLEQYEEMQTAIATISALVDTYKTDLEKGYTDAIAAAVADMEDAISDSEDAMEIWVNETLADGYYDIAAIDALLAALETKLSGTDGNLSAADAELAKQIEEQIKALEQASKDLTSAYEKAIEDAIEDNNGLVSKEIADAVEAATEAFNTKIDAINAEIESIKTEIALMKESIATIQAQITNITSSLDELEKVDETLSGLIESLNEAASALKTNIDNNAAADAAAKKALEDELASVKELITALQKEDKSLDTKIADLKTYVDQIKASVDNDVADAKTWVSTTFATLEQYEEMQTAIATISALVDTYKTDLEKGYTDAIAAAVADMEDAISDSEDAMEIWVNETLADGYYDIAAIDALLAALETKLSGTDGNLSAADAELAKQIEEQIKALEQASKDLTSAYEKAIEDAIEDNNGLVSKEIADAVEAATEAFNTKIDAINAEIESIKTEIALMKESIGALEDKFASRIQSIRFLQEYIDGKVELLSDNSPVTLTFLLSPNEAAQAVAAAYATNKNVVTAYLSRIQPRTRAVDEPTAINVTNVTGTANGMLTVEVNTKNLPADYWANNENANLFICISDGNSDVISEMIPTFYTVICELPSGSTFQIAVHAQLADDTKAIKFIANSKVVTEHQIGTSPAYMQLNGTTLEIHTAAKEFIFYADSQNMFSKINGCSKFANLTTIDFNDCINTAKVANMAHMFDTCEALNSLDLSSFDTANVTNMEGVFRQCKALKSLDLSSFNTSNVENMNSMFYKCEALESLDLSNFNTAKVEGMKYMFFGCKALTSLDLSGFDTANVEIMTYMFYDCRALTSLDLSRFDTAKVANMANMFDACEDLKSLDLSSFNTANVTDMSGMFYDCKDLESLDIRNFDMGKVTNSSFMFFAVGLSYNDKTGNRTPIKVTMALKSVLESMNVSTGSYAEYYITDQQSGLNDFGFGGHFSN